VLVDVLALGGKLGLAAADFLERVRARRALLAAPRRQAGLQLERAALFDRQRRAGEGVVLVLGDEVPAQLGELAGGRDGGDLGAAARGSVRCSV
jgi:hypothetical protein